jgi:hypothetical protein
MDKPIEEIKSMGELAKALLALTDVEFNEVIGITKCKRFERIGVVYCPDNPADQDTPEG